MSDLGSHGRLSAIETRLSRWQVDHTNAPVKGRQGYRNNAVAVSTMLFKCNKIIIESYLKAIKGGGGVPSANDSLYSLQELYELHLGIRLILGGRNRCLR